MWERPSFSKSSPDILKNKLKVISLTNCSKGVVTVKDNSGGGNNLVTRQNSCLPILRLALGIEACPFACADFFYAMYGV